MKKNIIIEISEPWNFTEVTGCDSLKGQIEGVCKGPNEKNWQSAYVLISLFGDVDFGGKQLSRFLVAPRYEGDTAEQVANGKESVVGIALVKDSNLKAGDQFSPEQVEYFAVGSIKEYTN